MTWHLVKHRDNFTFTSKFLFSGLFPLLLAFEIYVINRFAENLEQ
jgi:hypothetical protein